MMEAAAILAALALLGVGYVLGRWSRVQGDWTVPSLFRRKEGADGGATSSTEPAERLKSPDAPRSVLRRLAEERDSVRRLYAQLGFSPVLEQKIHRRLDDLRAQIAVEIPDTDAFFDAVEQAREDLEDLDDPEDLDDEASRRAIERAGSLIEDVWQLRDTPDAVVERLQSQPMEDQLPYIERIPMMRSGHVHWRTPLRVSVLRKQPTDRDAFRTGLDRLQALVENADLTRSIDATDDVREAIDRLRADLNAEAVYVPALLNRIEDAIERWLYEDLGSKVRRKKEELDDMLLTADTLRRMTQRLLESGKALEHAKQRQIRSTALQQARSYLGRAWVRTPWLTDTVLGNLLSAELLRARSEPEVSEAFQRRLAVVREEVLDQTYDPEESIRRLRKDETDGHFVHSLVFSLLRLRLRNHPVPS